MQTSSLRNPHGKNFLNFFQKTLDFSKVNTLTYKKLIYFNFAQSHKTVIFLPI